MRALRVLLALEFVAALGAWSVNVCVWPLAGLVMTGSLVTFLLTWERAPSAAQCDEPCDRRWPCGHVVLDGARGYYCAGPNAKFPCPDCQPESAS